MNTLITWVGVIVLCASASLCCTTFIIFALEGWWRIYRMCRRIPLLLDKVKALKKEVHDYQVENEETYCDGCKKFSKGTVCPHCK